MKTHREELLEDRLEALAIHAKVLVEKLDAGEQPNPLERELVRTWVGHAEKALA